VIDMAETKKHFGEVSQLRVEKQGKTQRFVRSGHRTLTNVFIR
jgi:hypothetical protein